MPSGVDRQWWIPGRFQRRRQKKQEQEQTLWKQCKGVRVCEERTIEGLLDSVSLLGEQPQGDQCRYYPHDESSIQEVIPHGRSQRAIDNLGSFLASIEWFYVERDNHQDLQMAVRILTAILKHGGPIQMLSVCDPFTSVFLQMALVPLLEGRPQTLSELRLVWTSMSCDLIATLEKLFETLPNLTRLVFEEKFALRKDPSAAEALVDMVAFTLQEFAIVDCYNADEDIQSLFTAIVSRGSNLHRSVKLKALRLEDSDLTDESMRSVIIFLRHAPALHTLDLSYNGLGEMSGDLLATWLGEYPTGPLKVLLLRSTLFNDATLKCVAKSIQNHANLEKLFLSSGEGLSESVLDETVEVLLQSRSLKQLEIGYRYLHHGYLTTSHDDGPKSHFDHISLLNNTTMTKLTLLSRVPQSLVRTVNFVCGRNSILDKLQQTDWLDASRPDGLYAKLFAHVLELEEGPSTLHYLLRSSRVPCEFLFSLV